MRSAPVRDALLVLAVAAGPLVAALVGVEGPLSLRVNLGPGDGPYVRGFTPKHEVDDKVGTHWTTYDAAVVAPVAISGPVRVSYRLARVLPETAEVDVSVEGSAVDHFSCRGGVFLERSAPVVAVDGAAPLEVAFRVDSHDRKGLGLRMDWVRVEAGDGARVRLAGGARWRAALLVALVFLTLRYAGWGARWSAALASPWAIAATVALLVDPWRTHRFLTGVPETLAATAVVGLALGWWLVLRGRLPQADLPRLALLAVVALLVRGLATNHPDFYYPDLMTHARLVEVLKEAGPGFFASPAAHLDAQGAWTKPAYGGSSILPYAVGFHALLAPWPLSYDALLTAEKLLGGVTTLVPLLVVWGLARRLAISPLGAVLMVAVPTYTSRLSFALLPALLGHALDMTLLLWLAGALDRIRSPRVWTTGALLVAACQLSYVSSVTNVSLLVAALAALAPWDADDGRAGRAAAILGMGLAGSALAVALYYRDFLGSATELLPRILEGRSAGASRYPIESFLVLAYERTRDFFDGLYPLLAASGLVLLRRRRVGRGLLGAWLATYLLLLLLRAKVPDVFRYGHETLLVTPLVCLASGEALTRLAETGAAGRVVAGVLLAFLAAQGALGQWRAVADQLGNAL